MKKIKNAYVWCEDGSFVNKGEVINYTKFYVNINGIDFDINFDKSQLKLVKQVPNLIQYEDVEDK